MCDLQAFNTCARQFQLSMLVSKHCLRRCDTVVKCCTQIHPRNRHQLFSSHVIVQPYTQDKWYTVSFCHWQNEFLCRNIEHFDLRTVNNHIDIVTQIRLTSTLIRISSVAINFIFFFNQIFTKTFSQFQKKQIVSKFSIYLYLLFINLLEKNKLHFYANCEIVSYQ